MMHLRSLTLGNQVVENLCGMSLLSPSILVLTHAMLQVEHWELLGGIGEILCGH